MFFPLEYLFSFIHEWSDRSRKRIRASIYLVCVVDSPDLREKETVVIGDVYIFYSRLDTPTKTRCVDCFDTYTHTYIRSRGAS